MRILLAGGAGYVGSMLAPSLIERGYEVKIIDLLWFGNFLPQEICVDQKDLFDCTENDFEGFDQVIFLGGLSNDPMAEFSPSMNFSYNAALPAYLAYISKRAGVKRFIFASTCSVYGYSPDRLYDEDTPVKSSYPYGISKLQGEKGTMNQQDANFSVIALRNGTVCGWSPRMRFDLIVNTMTKTALMEGRVTVNNPSIWRPILDMRDQVTAYLRAVQADYQISGVFNIASGNYTVGQIGDLVKAIVEEKFACRIELLIKNIQDFRNYKVSIERAATEVGFKPRYDIEDCVDSILCHLDEYGDLTNERFYNLAVFKKKLACSDTARAESSFKSFVTTKPGGNGSQTRSFSGMT
jgi:nucleoside-diphosphate-sugar epimerase